MLPRRRPGRIRSPALPLRLGGLLSASSSLLSDRLSSLSLQFVRSQPLCPGSYLKPGKHTVVKNPTVSAEEAGDMGSIPGQDDPLENSEDGG